MTFKKQKPINEIDYKITSGAPAEAHRNYQPRKKQSRAKKK